ncbi:hypothetical protein [Dyella agri]|uniref:Uncharacterized protein n=1 Tax=Dyella agri TaxID=1926869 RepID=A0ABW8KHY1_9GAMM
MKMVMVIEVETNARGIRAGASHRWTRWPRDVVDQAIAMRAAGMQLKAISEALGGPALSTVHYWATRQRRQLPARVVVKRIKECDSFGMNHQRTMPENVVQPEKQGPADEDAAVLSIPIPPSLPTPEID